MINALSRVLEWKHQGLMFQMSVFELLHSSPHSGELLGDGVDLFIITLPSSFIAGCCDSRWKELQHSEFYLNILFTSTYSSSN